MRNLIKILAILILVNIFTSCQKDEFYEEEFTATEVLDESIADQGILFMDPDNIDEGLTLEKVATGNNRSAEELIYESDRIDLPNKRYYIVYASRNFLERNVDCELTAKVGRTITQGDPNLLILGFNEHTRRYRFVRSSNLGGNAIDESTFKLDDLLNTETHIAIAVKARGNTQFILKAFRDCEVIGEVSDCPVSEVIWQTESLQAIDFVTYTNQGRLTQIKRERPGNGFELHDISYSNDGQIRKIETSNLTHYFNWNTMTIVSITNMERFGAEWKKQEYDFTADGKITQKREFTDPSLASSYLERFVDYIYDGSDIIKESDNEYMRNGTRVSEMISRHSYNSEMKDPFDHAPFVGFLFYGGKLNSIESTITFKHFETGYIADDSYQPTIEVDENGKLRKRDAMHFKYRCQ